MSILRITIPIGLGDIIYVKAMLDAIPNRYDQIKIKYHREIIQSYKFDPGYNKFLDDIGALFFSNPPYVITEEPGIPFYGLVSICQDHGITPVKPRLQHLMCKGEPLQIDGEYIVMVTKVRYLSRHLLDTKVMEMWNIIKQLSTKYKIVILGEREVQMHAGYVQIGTNDVYSIYDSIKHHVPEDRIIDLSIPALGISSPSLSQIRQDCLIMNKAKFVITLGVGGGFCMATAVANVIGYREDSDSIANVVFSSEYPDAVVTGSWNRFIYKLGEYLQ